MILKGRLSQHMSTIHVMSELSLSEEEENNILPRRKGPGAPRKETESRQTEIIRKINRKR